MGEAGTAATGGGGLASGLPLWVLGAAVVLAGVGGFLVRSWHRRRAARSIGARLRQVCEDMLVNVLLPDPDLGEIHLDFVLFDRQGVAVVDIRQATGHVFGSEMMQEWTVLSRNRRHTFANPLPALHDRVAAIRRLLPEMPVRGYVAFTEGADFSKGQPPHVVMLDELICGMSGRQAAVEDMGTRQLLEPFWQRLKGAVRPAGSSRRAAR